MLGCRIYNHVTRLLRPVKSVKPLRPTAAMSTTPGAPREIAVVGGGVSGLYCAYYLSKHGHAVTVFDQGKHAPGGRLTTRRTTWKGLQFDHGCQFIRPTTDEFDAICQEWLAAGALAPWDTNVVRLNAASGRAVSRQEHQQQQQQQQQGSTSSGFLDVLGPGRLYVGTPSSDAITKHLAAASGATVKYDAKVSRAAYDSQTGKWLLEGFARSPTRTLTDLKQSPPFAPWNLGIFDGLVLADKMTGTPGTPGYVELLGSSAGSKLQKAMSEVGSTSLLTLLMAYQPQEVPLANQAVAAAAAVQQQEQQQDGLQQGQPAAEQQSVRQVLHLPFDAAAVVNDEQIQWLCVDSAKPGRSRADGYQTLVALSTPAFAESLIKRNPDGSLPRQTPELLAQYVPPMFEAVQRVLAPLLQETHGKLWEPAFVQVHRWGSAFPAKPFGSPCLTAESAVLAACGDFCLGPGVEGAALSGKAAATAVMAMLNSSSK